ncbi:Hypothetical predicted protein, partial [Pelobates cultripes]
DEWRVVGALRSYDSIIVRAADKGGAIVVMDIDKYNAEAEAQLSNRVHYEKLSRDPMKEFQERIGVITLEAMNQGFINKKIFEFLNTPCIPFLYLLPKIHKDLLNPHGRPIVSGCGSLLQPLAQYVDAYLQVLV